MDLPHALSLELDKIELQLFESPESATSQSEILDDSRDMKLQQIIRSFDKPPRLHSLSSLLTTYTFSENNETDHSSEWFVLARAATVIIKSLMEELFTRSVPLGQDSLYWEQVMSSRIWRIVYALQTLPKRLYKFTQALSVEMSSQWEHDSLTLGTLRTSVFNGALLRRVAFPHLNRKNMADAANMLTFDTMIRQEIRKKLENLSGLRDAQAQSIGLLVSQVQFGKLDTLAADVTYIANLLETSAVHASRNFVKEQNTTFKEPEKSTICTPSEVASRFVQLSETFQGGQSLFFEQLEKNGRPSTIVRNWPLLIAALVGTVTSYRGVYHRKDRILDSIHELRDTVGSFWVNWIIEPTKRILATIRHDEGSEVALLSSRSLSADLESLERMVVEFAEDNPQYSQASSLEALKLSARNGDLTPVLVAYENNIKSPLRSALTGSLIRALLIQIQKTKVDVEVAINGIDKLLKSQELVFGFVGVSPALALVWFTLQWLTRLGKQGNPARSGHERLNSIKTLRSIDRLLCTRKDETILTYKRRGLILCEAQLLRTYSKCVASDLRRQYLEDLTDLERADDLQQLRFILTRIFRVYFDHTNSL